MREEFIKPRQPSLPIPPPLVSSKLGSFAHATVTQRLPAIAKRVIELNSFPPSIDEKLELLRRELLQGVVRFLHDEAAPDAAVWREYLEPYLGQSWLDIPWYFAEVYFYRRILEATGYFLPGEWQGFDPFTVQKHQGLVTAIASIQTLSQQVNVVIENLQQNDCQWDKAEVINLLYVALWGNRADLSLWVEGEHDRRLTEAPPEQTHVLVDRTAQIADKLASFEQVRLDVIVDNSGFELFCDLCLVDFLLATQVAQTIYLHLKGQPLFVSDALIKDVHYTLEVLAADHSPAVGAVTRRLQDYIASDRLRMREHAFWAAPQSFWEMPEDLRQELAQSQLVFVKGDANYRRLLGDRHWEFTTNFEDIVDYFPAPFLVALRTLKSEVAAGLQPEQVEALNQEDPQWLVNGKWGLIQRAGDGESSQ